MLGYAVLGVFLVPACAAGLWLVRQCLLQGRDHMDACMLACRKEQGLTGLLACVVWRLVVTAGWGSDAVPACRL